MVLAEAGIVAGVIFIIEDLITWKIGLLGLPFWVVLIVGFLFAYFFWRPLHAIVRILLKKVGIL